MKITCVKKTFTYEGRAIKMDSPITIGKSYEVLRKELKGPQGPSYENGKNEFYLYEIVNDEGNTQAYHEIFFDSKYINEIRDKKLNRILDI
jgi:hypothetical protein